MNHVNGCGLGLVSRAACSLRALIGCIRRALSLRYRCADGTVSFDTFRNGTDTVAIRGLNRY